MLQLSLLKEETYMNPIDPNFTSATIIHGDLLHILPHFPDGLFGGILTDPPYASGAADQNARQKSTAAKYSGIKGKNPFPDFEGDAKDQRMEFEDDYETPANEEGYLSPEEDDLTGSEDTE